MSLLIAVVAGLVVGAGTERLFTRPARGRRRGLRLAGGFTLMAVVICLVGGYLWAASVFNRIDKVDVSTALGHGSGTNYLLVGADNSRDPSQGRAGVNGVRSDTIMVLHIEGGHAKMLSLNRDLWVDNPATGSKGRLNATYNQGPTNLITAVNRAFGIPIDRYIEIDFVSFAGLVDAFGGIDVNFANPAFDLASGLDVKSAGLVHLDGAQALAYVRSRHYTEVIGGRNVPEGGLPDVNRTGRQQVFLRQIMAKAGSKRNPFTLMSAASKMAGGLRIDSEMSLIDAMRFAWNMGHLNPERVVLPVVPRRTSGGADVLDMGPGADAVLAQFR